MTSLSADQRFTHVWAMGGWRLFLCRFSYTALRKYISSDRISKYHSPHSEIIPCLDFYYILILSLCFPFSLTKVVFAHVGWK